MLEIIGMKTKPDCATVGVADDGVCLWSWFSSVQAATHNNKDGDRTRAAHHSGWDIPFWFVVSSPLLGVLAALLALAIFCR